MKNKIREEKKMMKSPKRIHSSMWVCYLSSYLLQLLGLYFICFDSFFWISRFHIIWFWSIFRSFQIKSYNQFKLMSRSTMGTCEGTSKSHIGQSVGRAENSEIKFMHLVIWKFLTRIRIRGGYLENPLYYVHCEKTELFPSSSSF